MTGWPAVPLRQVATIDRDVVEAASIESGTLYVGLEDIESGGEFADVRRVARGDLASSKFAFSSNHVLYGKLRPYLAKIARPNFAGVCSTDILPIRPGSGLDRNYLAHYLLTPAMVSFANSRAAGANLPRISPSVLAELPIPLPSLTEQRRIAAILDKADDLRAKRRAALAKLDTLIHAAFLDLFDGVLDGPAVDTKPSRSSVPSGCSWALLTDVARLATGHTPDRERAEYWNGDIPWISLTDIRSLDGTEATETIQQVTPLGIENSSSVLLPKGTVCFSRTASVGFVTIMGREMATSQDFMNWVCGPLVVPIYLMWALITSRPRLLALSTGSTHRTIYMRVVEQFRVLLPPIEAQREFARRVATIGRNQTAQLASLLTQDALFTSLQHRAFRGEL